MPKGHLLIGTGSEFEELFKHSRAVRVGRHVYVAGTTTSITPEGPVGGVDIAKQAREAFRRIELALDRAGASMRDVVRTRIFVTDIGAAREIGMVHALVFKEIRPTSTIVEVSSLVRPDFLVEIEVDAVAPEEDVT